MALIASLGERNAAAQSANEVREALEHAKDGTMQLTLPGEDEPKLDRPVKKGSFVPRQPEKQDATSPEWSELTSMLTWMVVICAGTLATSRFSAGMTWPWTKPLLRAQEDGRPYVPPPESQALLALSDGLSRNGHHAEAMHQLLVGSIHILRQRLDETISTSLTSREVARALALPADERAALTQFVTLVERSWFGTTVAGSDTYGSCRACFLKFTAASTVAEPV
jgi:hypothetical protein